MSKEDAAPRAGDSVPVRVILARAPSQMGQWHYEKSEVIGLTKAVALAPAATFTPDGRVSRALPLAFQKEMAESYWANLSGDAPQLFIVCRNEDGENGRGMEPVMITASGEEAAGYGEVDDVILPAPMPAWLGALLEQFVAVYYRPQAKKVRRRQ